MACPCKIILALLLLCAPAAAAPQRIVSLYPGHTDNIVALGAGDRLVAVSRNDDVDLFAAPDLPRLPPKTGPEAVLALRPDAVFTRSMIDRMNPGLREVLERSGVAVYVIDPPSWDGFEDYLARLAEILGTDPEEARQKLKAAREAVAENAAKTFPDGAENSPVVFLEATSKELHTCAPDSWAAHLIKLAGGRNTAENATPLREGSALAPWGIERVLAAAETLDVYLIQQGPMNAATADEALARPWFAALKNVRPAVVPENLLSRPSLLGLEKGGAMLTEIFRETAEKLSKSR